MKLSITSLTAMCLAMIATAQPTKRATVTQKISVIQLDSDPANYAATQPDHLHITKRVMQGVWHLTHGNMDGTIEGIGYKFVANGVGIGVDLDPSFNAAFDYLEANAVDRACFTLSNGAGFSAVYQIAAGGSTIVNGACDGLTYVSF
jgi:hypothetical protein